MSITHYLSQRKLNIQPNNIYIKVYRNYRINYWPLTTISFSETACIAFTDLTLYDTSRTSVQTYEHICAQGAALDITGGHSFFTALPSQQEDVITY